MSDGLDVSCINLVRRIAVMTDGQRWPITVLLDATGEETDDEDEAVAFVCGVGNTWISAPLSDFEASTLQ